MPEERDPRAMSGAAEQAAAAGDYGSAEQLLRDAALLQEASLGPLHPDLANTLNNLGVVCEMADKPADAEHFYRRAHTIATRALPPDHPFVATSGKNLRDFCEARGIPVEQPTAPPPAAPQPEPPAAAFVDEVGERPPHAESRSPGLSRSSWLLVIGILGACALMFVMIAAARSWFSSDGQAGRSPAAPTPPVQASPTPKPEPPTPATRPPESLPVQPAKVPKASTNIGSGTGDVQKDRATAAPAPDPPTIVVAQLCRDLSTGGSDGSRGDWHCESASGSVDPGTLFFYTRLRSANDTTVQHRWYRGGRLHQSVPLQIRANRGSGYRTYSRNTVHAGIAGDWRVQLRTQDGKLLHEERFVVR
jgi:Protein of unknown function (DUF2914)/Tetratricopeptide repeat